MPYNPVSKQLSRLLDAKKHEDEIRYIKKQAIAHNLHYVNLEHYPIERDALVLISKEQAEKLQVVIFETKHTFWRVACLDVPNQEVISFIDEVASKEKFKGEIKYHLTTSAGFQRALDEYEKIDVKEKQHYQDIRLGKESSHQFEKDIKTFEELGKKITRIDTSKIVETVVGFAISLGASDIHIEPEKERIRLRFRIDGILTDVTDLDKEVYKRIVNRFKILSKVKLNITDHAQDGRFNIRLAGDGKKEKNIDIRASFIPSSFGETCVFRLLTFDADLLDLEKLGFDEEYLSIITKEIKRPNGMILTSGPTGSGKSTTLYAFINFVKNPDIKIITIEDPIEYYMPGITQTQVDPESDYTFQNGLRSIVRQDPDVILVGEIRDYETAEIAMQAALTGHIVFSTIHANDAPSILPRLMNLGIREDTVSDAVNAVIAQRLVRKICTFCRRKVEVTGKLSAYFSDELSQFSENLPADIKKMLSANFQNSYIFDKGSCSRCLSSGYRGRTGLFELFVFNPEMKELVLQHPSQVEVRNLAVKNGMLSLRAHGLMKVLRGETTIEEVERVT